MLELFSALLAEVCYEFLFKLIQANLFELGHAGLICKEIISDCELI